MHRLCLLGSLRAMHLGAICEAQWRVRVGTVSTAELQQKSSTETVASVSSCSGTVASMTCPCSAWPSFKHTSQDGLYQE